MNLTKASFEKIYRAEQDARIKERMLLVLNVAYQGMVAAHVARDLHRCKAWASNWLKRYGEEGIEGLKDRPKSGRHSQMPEQTEHKIKTMLKESSQGWTTKQVEDLIIKMSGKHYHHSTHAASSAGGASSRRCQERCILTLHPKMRRILSKKGRPDTCG